MQTGKALHVPISMAHGPFWGELIEWFKATLVKQATNDAAGVDLSQVLDKPQQVVDAIFNHCESCGIEPFAEVQEMRGICNFF